MFREEVLKNKKTRLTGDVIVTQPSYLYFYAIGLFVVFLFLLYLAANSEYSRKETVNAYVVSQKGVIKFYSQRAGIIEQVFIEEGQVIKRGDNIATILNSQNLATGIELSQELSLQLLKQKKTLEQELQTLKVIASKSKNRIETQRYQLQQGVAAIKKEMDSSSLKVDLIKKQLSRNRVLHNKGYLSKTQLILIEKEYLVSRENHDRLQRELTAINYDISVLDAEEAVLPEQNLLKETSIISQISKIQYQLFELEGQYQFIEKAPDSGIVTALDLNIGSKVSPDTPLLSIVPLDSPLELELLLPTRAAGFVQIGDQVKIRFDAFPYEKFGFVTGEVIKIDKVLLLPADKVIPITINEAMYRVRAKLDAQNINAYGKKFPLKVGMMAEADVILDTRTLFEWTLEPMYSIKGRL